MNNAGFWLPAARDPGWALPMACRWAVHFSRRKLMRGILTLRYMLPALFASVIATAVSWVAIPDAPTSAFPSSVSSVVWALLAGPIAGVVSIGYVRLVT